MRKTAFAAIAGLSVLFHCADRSLAMGRVPKKEYEMKVAELEQLKHDFEKYERQCERDQQSLQAMLDQARMQKAEEVDRLKSTYDTLMEDMKKEVEQGSIQVTQLKDKLSVSLVDKILFKSGQAKLNEQGEEVLKKVSNILKNVKDKQIRIEGHTDNVPISESLKRVFPSNWELSTARATAVARYLQDMGGVTPELLTAAGYGQYRPIADNSTLEGRAKNRRIEIALIPLEIGAATPPPQIQEKAPEAGQPQTPENPQP